MNLYGKSRIPLLLILFFFLIPMICFICILLIVPFCNLENWVPFHGILSKQECMIQSYQSIQEFDYDIPIFTLFAQVNVSYITPSNQLEFGEWEICKFQTRIELEISDLLKKRTECISTMLQQFTNHSMVCYYAKDVNFNIIVQPYTSYIQLIQYDIILYYSVVVYCIAMEVFFLGCVVIILFIWYTHWKQHMKWFVKPVSSFQLFCSFFRNHTTLPKHENYTLHWEVKDNADSTLGYQIQQQQQPEKTQFLHQKDVLYSMLSNSSTQQDERVTWAKQVIPFKWSFVVSLSILCAVMLLLLYISIILILFVLIFTIQWINLFGMICSSFICFQLLLAIYLVCALLIQRRLYLLTNDRWVASIEFPLFGFFLIYFIPLTRISHFQYYKQVLWCYSKKNPSKGFNTRMPLLYKEEFPPLQHQ